MAHWSWRRWFLYFVNVSLFLNHLPLEKGGTLHLINLIYPSPKNEKMICAKFDWIWLSGSGEEDFLKLPMYFHYFGIICPWKNVGSFNKKTLKFLSFKDDLCLVWLKLAQFFWRRRFLKFINVFLLFCNYLPLEKGGALHLDKLKSPSFKDALCQVWLKLP